jgi:hypothetical protein
MISTIVGVVMQLSVRTVLDVGVGFGKYGSLAREYTDIRSQRYEKRQWQTVIHGVEPFKPFADQEHLWYIYDMIFNEDIETFLKRKVLMHYDLVFLCDVIEHIEKNAALKVIDDLTKIGSNLIITLPKGEFPQGSIFGNDWEEHRSTWNIGDIKNYSKLWQFDTELLYLIQRL